jgi:formylglycine-generating enzyme required for sulfatase activity
LVGPDGEWKLPPGAPPPAVAPFDAAKAKEHQAAWAKHLKVPVEMSNSIGMTLVLIPPGEFDLGSPKELIEEELKRPSILESRRNRLLAEGPRHHVRITQPFYLGMYPVTQEEYRRVTGTNPSEFSATGKGKGKVVGQDTGQFPVEMVSWNDAAEFCRRISDLPAEKAARRRYQLPTEAQWEYACRAGSTGRFCFSREDRAIPKEDEDRELSEYGWFAGNSDGMPHAVGLKRANAWGLCDMHGTIWQFCQDWFGDAYYAKSPVNDPGGPSNGGWRMGRGGCWNTPALECRSAYRLAFETGDRYNFQGFRVSVVLPEKPGAPGTRHAAPSIGRPAPNTPSPAPSPAVPAAEAAARNTLAKRCRDVLDDRQRDLVACSQSWWCFNGNAWENRAGELYRLAGEVARAQGK